MIIELPFRNGDQLPDDELTNLQAPTCQPRTTFQWPLDCLWPFIDHGPEDDT
jgi:hypothetical protein